jgi:Uncharacterized small protein
MSVNDQKVKSEESTLNQNEIEKLLNIIKTVRFGSITIIIQEGKIVQIEKNEKLRLK